MKKLYHLYNENFEITHAQFFIEGQQPSNAVYVENMNFIKPMVNPENLEVYEGATPEEIAEANRAKVPESISQMKLRKQLILSGISIASIYDLIQTLPQPNRDLIYTMWEYAVVFDRSNPELNAMAGMLGITQEQLDYIFINGNLL
jgi:hypothetical protein